MSKPHSQTVRGTLSNPNIPKSNNPPQLGDHVSLEREKTDTNPSQPASNPKGAAPQSQDKDDLPHSKKVRGTLAHADGPQVNKSMLGDPASLTAETSRTRMDGGTEAGTGKEKSKL